MENTTKRNTAISAAIGSYGTPEGTQYDALTLSFSNGEALTIRTHELSEEVTRMALMHGLKQKLVDAAAISRNPDTGRSATIDDKFNAVKTVYGRLLAGQWNATREGGGGNGGLLFRALVQMYAGRKTAEDIKMFLEGKTDAEKTALRKNPKVAAIIETLRATPANVDTDELLGELDG